MSAEGKADEFEREVVFDVPIDDYQRFEQRCARDFFSIADKLNVLIRQYLNEPLKRAPTLDRSRDNDADCDGEPRTRAVVLYESYSDDEYHEERASEANVDVMGSEPEQAVRLDISFEPLQLRGCTDITVAMTPVQARSVAYALLWQANDIENPTAWKIPVSPKLEKRWRDPAPHYSFFQSVCRAKQIDADKKLDALIEEWAKKELEGMRFPAPDENQTPPA